MPTKNFEQLLCSNFASCNSFAKCVYFPSAVCPFFAIFSFFLLQVDVNYLPTEEHIRRTEKPAIVRKLPQQPRLQTKEPLKGFEKEPTKVSAWNEGFGQKGRGTKQTTKREKGLGFWHQWAKKPNQKFCLCDKLPHACSGRLKDLGRSWVVFGGWSGPL